MARVVSHLRIRDAFPFHRLIAVRERSHARIIEIDLAAAADAGEGEGEVDVDVLSLRRLEDAVHAISVRRAAPDWLPFVPGSSYWFPPPRRAGGVVDVVKKLANPLTEEESMSLTTVRGWPSSAYFVKGGVEFFQLKIHTISNSICMCFHEDHDSQSIGVSHSIKKNMKKASAQSDDED